MIKRVIHRKLKEMPEEEKQTGVAGIREKRVFPLKAGRRKRAGSDSQKHIDTLENLY